MQKIIIETNNNWNEPRLFTRKTFYLCEDQKVVCSIYVLICLCSVISKKSNGLVECVVDDIIWMMAWQKICILLIALLEITRLFLRTKTGSWKGGSGWHKINLIRQTWAVKALVVVFALCAKYKYRYI